MAGLDADDLIGRTYLTEPYSDGNRTRMWIVELLDHDDQERMVNTSLAHFKAVNIDRTFEEIIEYNTILDRVEKVDGEDSECHFRSIDAYQVPLQTTDPAYRGSRWNVRVTWENGEVTYVPLSVIAKSDPVSCAIHAK